MDGPVKTVVRIQDSASVSPHGAIGIAGIDTPSATLVLAMSGWHMVAVRVARLYLMTVVGLLGASSTGAVDPIPALNFAHQLIYALQVALAPAIVSALWNTAEILTNLDVTNPGLRA